MAHVSATKRKNEHTAWYVYAKPTYDLPLDDTDDTTRELLARSELLSQLRLDQVPFYKDLVILTLIVRVIVLGSSYSWLNRWIVNLSLRLRTFLVHDFVSRRLPVPLIEDFYRRYVLLDFDSSVHVLDRRVEWACRRQAAAHSPMSLYMNGMSERLKKPLTSRQS